MARPKEFDTGKALAKAMELFWCYGYERTSLQDLLDHMEIGRASFYNTFGDKRNVFMMALEQYLTDMEFFMGKTVDEAPSGKQAIQTIFEGIMQDIIGDPSQKGCFMINSAVELSPYDEEVAQKIARTMQVTERAVLSALKRAQMEGEIGSHHDLPALAGYLMNTIRGMRVMARQSANPETLKNIVHVTLSTLN